MMKSFFRPTWFRIALLLVLFFSVAMIIGSYNEQKELEYKKLALEKNIEIVEMSDVVRQLTVYVKKDKAAIRICPSFDCTVVGSYNQGEPFPIDPMFRSWIELPEWVSFTPNGTTTTLFIHKSNLSETPIQ